MYFNHPNSTIPRMDYGFVRTRTPMMGSGSGTDPFLTKPHRTCILHVFYMSFKYLRQDIPSFSYCTSNNFEFKKDETDDPRYEFHTVQQYSNVTATYR